MVWDALVQFPQQRLHTRAPALGPPRLPAVQRQVPGDPPQPGPKCTWSLRRYGVPGPEISIVNALFRIVMAAEDIPGQSMEKAAVLPGGSRNGSLIPVPVEVNDLRIVHSRASFCLSAHIDEKSVRSVA